MKINIYPPMGEVLRLWLGERIKSCQPRLCAEFDNEDDSRLFQTLLEGVLSWAAKIVFVFVSFNDNDIVLITEKNHLEKLLRGYILRGITVTIVDPTNGDGCTVDWEGFDNDNTDSEVLVVAWGEHESIAPYLVEKLNAGTIFRGN